MTHYLPMPKIIDCAHACEVTKQTGQFFKMASRNPIITAKATKLTFHMDDKTQNKQTSCVET